MTNNEDKIMCEELYIEDFRNIEYDLTTGIDSEDDEDREITLMDFKNHVDTLIDSYGPNAVINFYDHGDYEFEVFEKVIETDNEYAERMENQKVQYAENLAKREKELEELQAEVELLREKVE